MKNRSILLMSVLSMSMTAYSMNLSWLGKLKPVVSRAASVACNYVKEHKVVSGAVVAVASAGAIAAIALYANKMYKKHVSGPKKLYIAIRTGNEHEVQVLLQDGVNPNIAYNDEPVLHAAVRAGNVAIVRLLCEYGANIEAINIFGYPPLFQAVITGKTEIVRILAQAGANIEAVDRNGYTALHWAASIGNTEIVRSLVQAGANIAAEVVNLKGHTALRLAVIDGNTEIVRTLVQAGANKEAVDSRGSTPLYQAVVRGNTEIVRILVQEVGANIDAVERILGYTALHRAVIDGNTEIVRTLVQAGANKEAVDSYGYTPLHLAVNKGDPEIVRILVQAGANKDAVNRNGDTPLHGAVTVGNAEIVHILVQAGANKDAVDRHGVTALHRAAYDKDKIEIVRILVQAGANTEAVGGYGHTSLHRAVIGGNTEIVRILVQAGANKEAVDSHGDTPLLRAVRGGSSEIVRILVQAGADTEAVFGDGSTLRALAQAEHWQEIIGYFDSLPQLEQHMHAAARAGNVGEVQELIAQGAPVLPGIVAAIREYNLQAPSREHGEIARLLLEVMGMRQAARAKCADGRTLLHVAAACGNTKFAEALARYGADVNAVDVIGNTPLHLAKTAEMNACLLRHGGAGLDGLGFAVENKAREIPFLTQINQWMPWFRKWVEEDQKIPALFTGTVQS